MPGLIAYSTRFFEIVENIASIEECAMFPPKTMNPLAPSWPFPEVWPPQLQVALLGEADVFHSIRWHNQRICLSPMALSHPFISHNGTEVSLTSGGEILYFNY